MTIISIAYKALATAYRYLKFIGEALAVAHGLLAIIGFMGWLIHHAGIVVF